ncbi:MAG: hypothetical protein QW688_07285 [Thermoprotei archaeon]
MSNKSGRRPWEQPPIPPPPTGILTGGGNNEWGITLGINIQLPFRQIFDALKQLVVTKQITLEQYYSALEKLRRLLEEAEAWEPSK